MTEEAIQLKRIADLLEKVIDTKKQTLRMVDVDRGKVYKTHLGGKLRKKKDSDK